MEMEGRPEVLVAGGHGAELAVLFLDFFFFGGLAQRAATTWLASPSPGLGRPSYPHPAYYLDEGAKENAADQQG